MGVIISPSSELGKELRKWEQHHTQYSMTEEGDSQPGNPYRFRPYPAMLYKAHKRPNGQTKCMDGIPSPFFYPSAEAYERACLEIESFNKSCQLIVHNEAEAEDARRQGWRESPKDAEAYLERLEEDMATAAAEANFRVQGMSEKARQEWNAAHETTHEHVVDVQGKKRGRKPKVIAGSGPVEG